MKKTPWFDGSVKPVHVGVYECQDGWYQYWTGQYWGFWMKTVDAAFGLGAARSLRQNPTWRGITKEQA